jgi:hypothetical protein
MGRNAFASSSVAVDRFSEPDVRDRQLDDLLCGSACGVHVRPRPVS